ncbi:hypothetical protein J6590_058864 [Homalodisca vitripennis]|nr:hypothetical protein J6590_058861 [Homalodisca vitripennis]KAG8310711.1 hypothetical protein J6590_058864 [Homalodisca vitripennis]
MRFLNVQPIKFDIRSSVPFQVTTTETPLRNTAVTEAITWLTTHDIRAIFIRL